MVAFSGWDFCGFGLECPAQGVRLDLTSSITVSVDSVAWWPVVVPSLRAWRSVFDSVYFTWVRA